MITRQMRWAVGGLVIAALAIGLAAGVFVTQPARAQFPPPPAMMQGEPLTHDEMHQMMDAMHGAGTSERLHAALGEDTDRMMEQCQMMMAMMPTMMQMGR